MKIIHFFPWTLAFTDSVIQLFEKTKYENEYLCLEHSDDNRGSARAKSLTIPLTWEEMKEKCKSADADIYMFHSLPGAFYDFILSVPTGKIIIASTWGWDIYESQNGCPPLCPLDLYKHETEATLQTITNIASGNSDVFLRSLRYVKSLLLRPRKRRKLKKAIIQQNHVIERIDYWATILPSEFDLLQKHPLLKGQYFPFQYCGNNDVSKILPANGNTILIGNSSTPTNNHIDILKILKGRKICNPVYLPMAYGDKTYLTYVKNYATQQQFNYFLQDSFMPYDDYCNIIGRCSVAIFGHIRQQALGNVYLAFLHGMKVFFWKDSVTYHYLHEKGCHIYTIEEDLDQESVSEPLTNIQIAYNREIIEDLFSFGNVFQKLSNTLRVFEDR